MAGKPIVARVVLPTVAAALTTSLIAIVINIATAWQTNVWAWVAVGVLTLLSAGISLWLFRRQGDDDGGRVTARAEIGKQAKATKVDIGSTGDAEYIAGDKSETHGLVIRAGSATTDKSKDD